jgi:PhnB protein
MTEQAAGPRPQEQTLTPYLTVRNAAGAIEFYRRAFGATELDRQAAPDGRLLHAVLRFGNARLFLSDEFPDMDGCRAPQSLGGTTATMHLDVPDADAAFARAVAAGATASMPVIDAPWGARYGKVTDPFGHEWSIGTQVEELSNEERERRFQEAFGAPAPAPA